MKSLLLLIAVLLPQIKGTPDGTLIEYSRGVINRPFQRQAETSIAPEPEVQAEIRVAIAAVKVARAEIAAANAELKAAQAEHRAAETNLATLIRAAALKGKVPDTWRFDPDTMRFLKPQKETKP